MNGAAGVSAPGRLAPDDESPVTLLHRHAELATLLVQDGDRAVRRVRARHAVVVEEEGGDLDLGRPAARQRQVKDERLTPHPRVRRNVVDPKVAEAVGDRPPLVELDPVHLVGVIAKDGVRPGVDQRVAERPLVGLQGRMPRRPPGRGDPPNDPVRQRRTSCARPRSRVPFLARPTTVRASVALASASDRRGGITVIHRAAILSLALLVSMLAPFAAAARQGTPVATTAGPSIGTAVPFIGSEGGKVGELTVTEIVDPFLDYDANYATPQHGHHFALLTVTVANTGTRPLTVDPFAFVVVDSDGYVLRPAYLARPGGVAVPDLVYSDVAPGDAVTGAVGFQVLNGVTIERVLFSPDYSRMVTLVDLRPAPTPVGATTPFVGPEGDEIGQVTVNQIIDPFQDYDPSTPPQRGNRYVLIDVTIANTGTRSLRADSGQFLLVDREGFVASPTYVALADPSLTEFPYGDLPSGALQSGVIGFQTLVGTEVAAVIFAPTSERHLVVAEPSVAVPAGDLTTPAVPTEVTPTTPPVTDADACAGLEAWVASTRERAQRIGDVLTAVGSTMESAPTQIDPAPVRQAAAEIAALAEEQRASSPPPAGEPLNALLADTYEKFSSALSSLADAAEANNLLGVLQAANEVQEVSAVFDDGGEVDRLIDDFALACPAVRDLFEG